MHMCPYPHWSRRYREAVRENIGFGKLDHGMCTIALNMKKLQTMVGTQLYWALNCDLCVDTVVPPDAIEYIVYHERGGGAYIIWHRKGAVLAPVGFLQSGRNYIEIKGGLGPTETAPSRSGGSASGGHTSAGGDPPRTGDGVSHTYTVNGQRKEYVEGLVAEAGV